MATETLDKMAPVQTGDVVRIRETIKDNGRFRGCAATVTDVMESPDAAQGQTVFLRVHPMAKALIVAGEEGTDVPTIAVAQPGIPVTNVVVAEGIVMSREQIRPLMRKLSTGEFAHFE